MYTIVILAEQALTAGDAQEVVSLHEEIEEPRHYHVLIPCDNAARRVEQALGTLASHEILATSPVLPNQIDVEAAQREIDTDAAGAVTASVAAIEAMGAEATGEFTSKDPIDVLSATVTERQAAEVIVMTRPHIVAELLHLDWTSRARRRLGVPLLHLLEHEPLDAEAGNGQGITGM
jgi:hypothetical protein